MGSVSFAQDVPRVEPVPPVSRPAAVQKENFASMQRPISRAELAAVIVETLKHNRNMVSEFPFYRDVPLNHPAYRNIEVARERGLMTYKELAIEDGFFRPDAPVTHAELYRVLERSLTGNLPPVDAGREILNGFEDEDALKDDLVPVAAKLKTSGVLNPDVDQHLAPEAIVTKQELTILTQRLAERLAMVRFKAKPDPGVFPMLPVGLELPVEPATVILKTELAPGDKLTFTLSEDTMGFARGARLQGTVMQRVDEDHFVVLINEMQDTDEAHYRTNSRLDLKFPKSGFFAPGDPLTLVTR